MSLLTRNKFGAILAFIIGVMPIYAGSRVLMGIDHPDHVVLDWLVIYNVVMGAISVITAYSIWTKRKWRRPVSWTIFGFHAIVLLLLLTLIDPVAVKSQIAMTIRSVGWGVISLFFLSGGKR